MFTEEDKKIKRWRSDKRKLKTARNKVKRLEKALKDHRYETEHQKKELQAKLQDAKMRVANLELKVGDKPE